MSPDRQRKSARNRSWMTAVSRAQRNQKKKGRLSWRKDAVEEEDAWNEPADIGAGDKTGPAAASAYVF